MTIKVCKRCQKVVDVSSMPKNRCICRSCFKAEYKENYLKVQDKLKEKRKNNKILDLKLIEENKQLKEELEKTKSFLSSSTNSKV